MRVVVALARMVYHRELGQVGCNDRSLRNLAGDGKLHDEVDLRVGHDLMDFEDEDVRVVVVVAAATHGVMKQGSKAASMIDSDGSTVDEGV